MNNYEKEFRLDKKQNSGETKNLEMDIEWKNQINYDDSDDLFSDEEQQKLQRFNTPEIPIRKNVVNNMQSTTILSDPIVEITPGKPYVPHTPLSLLPLIDKSNQTWTSQMETPNADIPQKSTVTPVDSFNKTMSQHISNSNMEEDSHNSSPVFTSKKRRKPKRCIFKTVQNTSNFLIEPLTEISSSDKSSFNIETVKDGDNSKKKKSELENEKNIYDYQNIGTQDADTVLVMDIIDKNGDNLEERKPKVEYQQKMSHPNFNTQDADTCLVMDTMIENEYNLQENESQMEYQKKNSNQNISTQEADTCLVVDSMIENEYNLQENEPQIEYEKKFSNQNVSTQEADTCLVVDPMIKNGSNLRKNEPQVNVNTQDANTCLVMDTIIENEDYLKKNKPQSANINKINYDSVNVKDTDTCFAMDIMIENEDNGTKNVQKTSKINYTSITQDTDTCFVMDTMIENEHNLKKNKLQVENTNEIDYENLNTEDADTCFVMDTNIQKEDYLKKNKSQITNARKINCQSVGTQYADKCCIKDTVIENGHNLKKNKPQVENTNKVDYENLNTQDADTCFVMDTNIHNENYLEKKKSEITNVNKINCQNVETQDADTCLVMDTMNTSSQDFFNNASFSVIDKICQDHANASEFQSKKEEALETDNMIEKNTAEIVRLCREQLKSKRKSIELDPNCIIPTDMLTNSIEQELLSIQMTKAKPLISQMPSGVTVTELLDVCDKSEDFVIHEFKKPVEPILNDANNYKNLKEKTEKSIVPDTSCSETQLLASCDLTEFMDDFNEWPGQIESVTNKGRNETQETITQKNDNLNKQSLVKSNFQNASGQSIFLNENKLASLKKKYEQFLDENIHIAEGSITKENYNDENSFTISGFQKASGEKIFQSEDKLASAEKIYKELLTNDPRHRENLTEDSPSLSSIQSPTVIDNRQIFNENKLIRAPTLSNESSLTSVSTGEMRFLLPSKTINSGFKIASGKSISLNKDSLKIAQSLTEDILTDSLEKTFEPFKEKPESFINLQSTSSTIVDENININENKWSKVKQMFEEHTKSIKTDRIETEFEIISGSNVLINKNKVLETQKQYDEDVRNSLQKSIKYVSADCTTEQTKVATTHYRQEQESSKIQSSFKTGTGENILIGNAELSKAKLLYEEDMKRDTSNKIDLGYRNSNAGTICKTKLSEDETVMGIIPNVELELEATTSNDILLNKSKLTEDQKLFDNNTKMLPQKAKDTSTELVKKITESNSKQSELNAIQSGFKTGIGENIFINKEKISKAKKMFEADATVENSHNVETRFKTGNGGHIFINKEKLSNAQKLLDENSTNLSNLPTSHLLIKKYNNIMPIEHSTISGTQDELNLSIQVNALDMQTVSNSSSCLHQNIVTSLNNVQSLTRHSSDSSFNNLIAKEDNFANNLEKTETKKGLKRKWLSDGDIKYHSTEVTSFDNFEMIEEYNLEPDRKKYKRISSKKSASFDNCFDFATDFIMSHLYVADEAETSVKHGLPDEVLKNRHTYPFSSKNQNFELNYQLSLPETNLRKHAMNNAAILQMEENLANEQDFVGFSSEEIQQSAMLCEKMKIVMKRYLEMSTCSLKLNMSIGDSIKSSQLKLKQSLSKSDIYFSELSNISLDQNLSVSSETKDITFEKSGAESFYKMRNVISGSKITKENAIDVIESPFFGFSPTKNHPVNHAVVKKAIEIMNKKKLTNTDKDEVMKMMVKPLDDLSNKKMVLETEDSPFFDYHPFNCKNNEALVNEGLSNNNQLIKEPKENMKASNQQVDNDMEKEKSWQNTTPVLRQSETNRKSINLSDDNLNKVKKLLNFDKDNVNYVLQTRSDNIFSSKKMPGGFKTASGQDVNVSIESITRARKLFHDCDNSADESKFAKKGNYNNETTTPPENASVVEPNSNSTSSRSVGFATASGCPINISAEKLEIGKRLFADIIDTSVASTSIDNNSLDNLTKSSFNIETSENLVTPFRRSHILQTKSNLISNSSVCSVGFATATGCPINISAEKLESAKRLFADVDDSSFESVPIENNMMSKRKIDSSDSDTPLTRGETGKFKKPRTAAELHARKLFDNSSKEDKTDKDIGDLVETKKISILTEKNDKMDIDSSDPQSNSTPTSPIIGNRRRRLKRKLINLSCTISGTKEKDIVCDNKKIVINRHSVPPAFGFNEENRTDFICDFDVSDNIVEDRLAAAILQDKMIQMKRRNKPKSTEGRLLKYRTSNRNHRISLKTLTGGKAPQPKTIEEIEKENLDPEILNITASNAASYSFQVSNIVGGNVDHQKIISVNLTDNVRLVLNENGYATIAEFRRAFLASPGIDPSLIPLDWIDNHYGLIVWKLASMDRMKFNDCVMPKFLTVNRVMEELKYRYDREIDKSERSAIKKILEKDETASKRLVLCVSSISKVVENENQEKDKSLIGSSLMYKVEATDGWYNIPITFDTSMLHYIKTGKIKEGTKIITYGAELLGCDQGCHPLERTSNVSLKIHTNSTRRVKWYAKMGFQRNSEPFPIKLQSVDPNGGTIGKISVVVARIFPILYKETIANGKSIFRNIKCEEKAAASFERECQNKIETLYAKAEKDYQNIADCHVDSLTGWDSDKIASASQTRQVLAHRQAKQQEFKQKLEQELRANLPPRRRVTPVLKIRVADEDTCALLTIWSANDDVFDSLKEGSCVSIYNASASDQWSNGLHLSFNSFSLFKIESTLSMSYPVRTYTPIADLQKPGFNPPYNEFDTVGIISSITDAPRGMKNFEVVNIAFPVDDTISKYLSIFFWQGLSTSGYNSILTKGSIIACSNLEWRCNSSWNIPAGYYSEKTSFSCNPRQSHLREPFEYLRNQIKNRTEYIAKCADEIAQEFEKMSTKHASNPGTPANKSVYSNSPQTPAMQNYTDKRTPTSSRSSFVQKRMEMLNRYGEAPVLSPVVMQSSSRVNSEFIPLQRTPNLK